MVRSSSDNRPRHLERNQPLDPHVPTAPQLLQLTDELQSGGSFLESERCGPLVAAVMVRAVADRCPEEVGAFPDGIVVAISKGGRGSRVHERRV